MSDVRRTEQKEKRQTNNNNKTRECFEKNTYDLFFLLHKYVDKYGRHALSNSVRRARDAKI